MAISHKKKPEGTVDKEANKIKRLEALAKWRESRIASPHSFAALYPNGIEGTTPAVIDVLPDHTYFVFGSNTGGMHGKGAAKQAHLKYGAQWGIGEGFTGKSYAIPTKNKLMQVLPLPIIAMSVRRFLGAAKVFPHRRLWVTAIGCGLAHYTPSQIAPMFYACGPIPKNVWLPREFQLHDV